MPSPVPTPDCSWSFSSAVCDDECHCYAATASKCGRNSGSSSSHGKSKGPVAHHKWNIMSLPDRDQPEPTIINEYEV